MSLNFELSSDLLIDAKMLKNNSIQKKQIKEAVIEIVRKINSDLKFAHREGRHCIIIDIPIQFDIPNMSNADAQRSVWSTIIEFLQQKNYRVWISFNDIECKLKITWISKEDELVLKTQNKIISDNKSSF